MEIQIHPTEMSQGENGSNEEVTVSIVDQMEIQIHPTEMSQGVNGSDEEALQRLTSTIIKKIGEGAQKTESLFSSACIYKVPEELRTLKESAYTPRLIAIGPLHQEDKHLQTPFQHVKMSYTNNLLSRLTAEMENLEYLAEKTKFTVVQECLVELKTSIDDAEKCYVAEVTLNEEMMLVDGCFILELFYGGYHTLTEERAKDPIFGNSFNFETVKNDLVLLENQIPFFVLEKLFQLTVHRLHNNKNRLLTDYVRRFYDEFMRPLRNSNDSGSAKSSCTTTAAAEEVESGNINDHRTTAKYYHILHYLHDCYLPNVQTEPENFDFREMPSASELAYAGVKFVPDTGNDLFKFKFSKPEGLFRWCHSARFVIPPLLVHDGMEALLRNLIAVEQFCPGVSQYVSSYVHIMDALVNTDKDIQALEKAGVLRNWLGATQDATDLFNNLCKEIVAGEYFLDTCREATEYSKRFWPKNMAHVRRTYFSSPLTSTAFFVGLIVFIMTVLQFVHDFFN